MDGGIPTSFLWSSRMCAHWVLRKVRIADSTAASVVTRIKGWAHWAHAVLSLCNIRISPSSGELKRTKLNQSATTLTLSWVIAVGGCVEVRTMMMTSGHFLLLTERKISQQVRFTNLGASYISKLAYRRIYPILLVAWSNKVIILCVPLNHQDHQGLLHVKVARWEHDGTLTAIKKATSTRGRI